MAKVKKYFFLLLFFTHPGYSFYFTVACLAERVSENGEPITSALDHIYRSTDLKDLTQCCKLQDASTDHVPIKISINWVFSKGV